MIDPLFTRLASAALGLLLVTAAWHKFSMGVRLQALIADYRLLPESLAALAARIVPLLEAAIGLLLLGGVGVTGVALSAATLFSIYGLAIAINILRGRVHIDCGCGLGAADRSASGQPLSWWMVLRNVLFAGLALLPLLPAATRSLGTVDWLTVAAALIAMGLLYGAVLQLTANGAAIRTWRLPSD